MMHRAWRCIELYVLVVNKTRRGVRLVQTCTFWVEIPGKVSPVKSSRLRRTYRSVLYHLSIRLGKHSSE